MSVTYRPRLDFVLIRITNLEVSRGGVALPEVGVSGKRFTVVATGPDVEDLPDGSRVQLVAAPDQGTYFPLPRSNDLILVREEFVACIIEGDD